MWRIDHDGLATLDADVDPDVGDLCRTLTEEHKVARLKRRSRRHQRPRVVLVLGDPGQGDAGGPVGGLDEAGAVEAVAGGLTAADLRRADLGERPVERHAPGGAGSHGPGLALAVGVGEGEDLIDVPGRVVVLEHRS